MRLEGEYIWGHKLLGGIVQRRVARDDAAQLGRVRVERGQRFVEVDGGTLPELVVLVVALGSGRRRHVESRLC